MQTCLDEMVSHSPPLAVTSSSRRLTVSDSSTVMDAVLPNAALETRQTVSTKAKIDAPHEKKARARRSTSVIPSTACQNSWENASSRPLSDARSSAERRSSKDTAAATHAHGQRIRRRRRKT